MALVKEDEDMHGRWKRIPAGSRERRPRLTAWDSVALESLEERKLLSSGLGGFGGGFGSRGMRAAELSSPNQPASSSTSTSSSPTTQSTLQSVSEYLVGVPGVSTFGMRSLPGFGMGPGGGPRGGLMNWR